MTNRIVSGTDLLWLAMGHSTVWAIDNAYSQAALTYLTETQFAEHMASFEARVAAPLPAPNRVRPEDRTYAIEGGVALIPIQGVMTMKPTSFGGCSTILTRRAIRMAADDQDVKSIVLLVNSPGGTVEGTEELALTIGEAAKSKDVTSYIQGQCGSAAYWVATYGTKIVSHRHALTGSIGCFNSLTDSSEAAAKDGRKVILVSSRPKLKGQGTPGVPISDEAIAMVEGHVEYFGDDFDAIVLRNRKLSAAQAKDALTGGTFVAPEALRLGLIDAIQPLDDLLADLQESTVTEEDIDPGDQVDELSATGQPATATATIAAQAVQTSAPTTISAPGGQPGPAGTRQAPQTGAENQPAKGSKPMLKPLLVRALTRLGYGLAATNLANSTEEDPDGLAAVLVGQFDTEIKAKVEANPLIMACHANGIDSVDDLRSVLEAKAIGDRVMKESRAEAHRLAIVAHGAENGPKFSAAVDHLGYDQVITMRESFRAQAGEEFGTTPTQGAARGSAPTQPMPRAKDVTETPMRAMDRIDDPKVKAALMAQAGGDEAKQERLATDFLKNLQEIE